MFLFGIKNYYELKIFEKFTNRDTILMNSESVNSAATDIIYKIHFLISLKIFH